MIATLSGIVTEVREVQYLKASTPIHVTFFPSISDGIESVVAEPK